MTRHSDIEARHARYTAEGTGYRADWCNRCNADWPCDAAFLLAEVERLRAQVHDPCLERERDAAVSDADRLAEALRRSVAAAKSIKVFGPGSLSTRDMTGSWVAAEDALAAHEEGADHE